MLGFGGADDFAAKGLTDCLMTKADAQKGHVIFRSFLDQGKADTGVIGVAWAGRDHDTCGGGFKHIIDTDLVIAMDNSLDAQVAEILDQVIGEAVIIIDQDDAHYPMVIPGRCGLGKSFDSLYNISMRRLKPKSKLYIHTTDTGTGRREPPPGRWRFMLLAIMLMIVVTHYIPTSWWVPKPIEFKPPVPEKSVTVPIEKEVVATAEPPAEPPVPVPVARPEPSGPPASPEKSCQIALVIDDMGVNLAKSREVLAIQAPLTLSFLPYAPRVAEMAAEAKAKGHELMVHIPMEPLSASENPGDNALLTGMTPEQLLAVLDKNLSAFTGYAGINNHMGSKFTQDEAALRILMPVLKERGLYWLDSKTIAASRAYDVALEAGVPAEVRDVFLDDDVALEAVRFQTEKTLRIAVERGLAVAIGHPKENTISAIQEYLPKFAAAGCEIVPLSRLIATKEASETPVQPLPEPTSSEPAPY